MADLIEKAKILGKEDKKLPKDAKVIEKQDELTVEEIENGFIITKRSDITYSIGKNDTRNWMTINKKWYSESNPLTLNLKTDSNGDADDKLSISDIL